jgi:hypothetical protein
MIAAKGFEPLAGRPPNRRADFSHPPGRIPVTFCSCRRRVVRSRPRIRVSCCRGDIGQWRQYGRAVFEYVPRRVGGETSRFVDWIWFARGRITGVRERIAPTGSTVAAVVLGDPIRQTRSVRALRWSPTLASSSGRTTDRSSTSLRARRSASGSSPPRLAAGPLSGSHR